MVHAPVRSEKTMPTAIVSGAADTATTMNTKNVTRAILSTLASLIGYPPVMHEMVTRRLGG